MKLRIIPPDKFTDNVIQRWITKHNSLIGSIILFFFVCIFSFVLVVYIMHWREYISQEKILRSEGIKTHGKVISKNMRGSGKSAGTLPTLEFLDNNFVKHRFESKYDFRCRVGDIVSVMYLPSKPEFAAIESAGADKYKIKYLMAMIAALLFALFLFSCSIIYPLIERRQRQQRKRRREAMRGF